MNNAAVSKLRQIQQRMLELLDYAEAVVRQNGSKYQYEKARSYWLADIRIALVKEHDYAAGSMCCMDDTIDSMSGVEEN